MSSSIHFHTIYTARFKNIILLNYKINDNLDKFVNYLFIAVGCVNLLWNNSCRLLSSDAIVPAIHVTTGELVCVAYPQG